MAGAARLWYVVVCRSRYEYCLPAPQARAGVCKLRGGHYAYLFLTRTAPELAHRNHHILLSSWLNEKWFRWTSFYLL